MSIIEKREWNYPIKLYHTIIHDTTYVANENKAQKYFKNIDDLVTGIYTFDDYDLWVVDEDKTTYITEYDEGNLYEFEITLHDLYEVQGISLKDAIPIANDITLL